MKKLFTMIRSGRELRDLNNQKNITWTKGEGSKGGREGEGEGRRREKGEKGEWRREGVIEEEV